MEWKSHYSMSNLASSYAQFKTIEPQSTLDIMAHGYKAS